MAFFCVFPDAEFRQKPTRFFPNGGTLGILSSEF